MTPRAAVPVAPPETRLPTSQPLTPARPREDLRTYVTISREHANDVGHRQVVVQLNREPRVELLFGDSFTQEIQPGSHRLYAHNTLFWKTIRFTAEPGEHLEFVVINRAGPLTLSLLAIAGVAPLYLTIERRSLV
jgi:hypothetical protein